MKVQQYCDEGSIVNAQSGSDINQALYLQKLEYFKQHCAQKSNIIITVNNYNNA